MQEKFLQNISPGQEPASNTSGDVTESIRNSQIYLPRTSVQGSVLSENENKSGEVTKLQRSQLASFIQRKKNDSSGIYNTHGIIQRQPAPVPIPPLRTVTPVITQRYRPTGSITRQEFDRYVKTNFGVADVHTGTQQEQEQRSTRLNIPTVTIPNWQRWDPGTASDDYTSIINGIENMADALGAIPTISTITFFKVFYNPDAAGTGIPDTSIGATFGAGSLTIFEAFSGSTYPAIGINTASGAPTAPANRERDIAHTITHELGHGVAEAAMASQNNQTFVEFRAAVGWIGTPEVLYDIGQPTVRAAIANQTQPPSQHRITPARWYDNTVSEQPMSRYAIDGGPSEDFAESIAAYINNPSVLQQRSPARYTFIRNNINTWRTRMRATMPARVRPPVGDFPIPEGDRSMA
jgi:hypothetical protein